MKWNLYFFIAVMIAFGSQVAAQECDLSSECADNEYCINLECAVPQHNAAQCTSENECDYMFACVGGICKPEGVYCENVAGWGILDTTSSIVSCVSGMGQGSDMGGIDCAGDDPTCGVSSIEELSEAELNDLYASCDQDLVGACGTETPVPAEECSPEALAFCTDWMSLVEEIDTLCEDHFSTPDPDGMEPSDEDVTSGDKDEDSTWVSSDTDVDNGVPSIDRIVAPQGLAAVANPWFIVECCEAYERDEAEADVAAANQVLGCIEGASTRDCDAVSSCFDDVDDKLGWDIGGTLVQSNSDEAGGDGSDNDSRITTDDGPADAENAGTTTQSSDSGCSMAISNTSVTSLISLLL